MEATDRPLSRLRQEFTAALAELIVWANQQGTHRVALDDVKAHDGHKAGSFHYRGLAADLLLYEASTNRYLTDTEDYRWLGEEWERRGGTWGGRFKREDGKPKPDGNHFSWGE